jgi:hypothetical protein
LESGGRDVPIPPGITWEWVSIVCEIVACPSISETILGLTFFDTNPDPRSLSL